MVTSPPRRRHSRHPLNSGRSWLVGERRRNRPWGLAGGEAGATGEDWLLRPNSAPERLPGKTTLTVHRGDRLLVRTPGGGGWGTP